MNDMNVNPNTVKESVSTLVDQGGAAVSAIKNRFGDVSRQFQDGGSAALEGTRAMVVANPFKSLAVAFGIGYVAMRVRTSPLFELAFLGGLAYLGSRAINK